MNAQQNSYTSTDKPLGLHANFSNYNSNFPIEPTPEQLETVNRWNRHARKNAKQDTNPMRVVLPKRLPSNALIAFIATLVLFIMPFAVYGYYMAWTLLIEAFPRAVQAIR
jgi:hypothetical protein